MEWFGIIGTIAFAMSGYLLGIKKNLDILGIAIVTLLTAVGGGVIRDVLVNRIPQIFVVNDALFITIGTLFVLWVLRIQKRNHPFILRMFIIADSLGLIAFSIAGAQLGLAYELNAFGVAMLGFITAVGGGIVRDMLVNDIPFILHEDFYGTVAILVAVAVWLLDRYLLLNWFSLQCVFVSGLLLRLIAHWRELKLPKLADS